MQRLEQAGVNIKGAILNGVIKRASTAYSYGLIAIAIVTPRKSKAEGKVTGCGVNSFPVYALDSSFGQPQSIQVAECSFMHYKLHAGMRASFTICVKPANEHMPCAFRFHILPGSSCLSGGVFNDSGVLSRICCKVWKTSET
jgi:hypothetical protein